jgi:hypothetical protein
VSTEQSNEEAHLRTAKILWGAFAMSFLMFIFVVFTVHQGQAAIPERIAELGPIFGLMALSCLGMMPWMRTRLMGAQTLPLLMKPPGTGAWDEGLDAATANHVLTAAHAKYRTGMIIGMALCESAVLFGFAVAFMGKMPIVILPFAGAGLAGLAWQFPTEAGVLAIARAMASPSWYSRGEGLP